MHFASNAMAICADVTRPENDTQLQRDIFNRMKSIVE